MHTREVYVLRTRVASLLQSYASKADILRSTSPSLETFEVGAGILQWV